MTIRTDSPVDVAQPHAVPKAGWFRDLFERQGSLGYILMGPSLLLLAIFMVYPFVHAIEFALRSDRIGTAGEFVGLANFMRLVTQDSIFRQSVGNTFYYTFWATVFKVLFGLIL